MARYSVATQWKVEAPVERVWDTLLLVGEWPSWWPGFRSVEQIAAGDDRGVGRIIRQRWRALLPMTLTLDLRITTVERRQRLEARVSGDMTGTCRWTFSATDGMTLVTFSLDVRPTRAWMNLPVPFAGRVFAANYEAIMRWGRDGLVRQLAETAVDESGAEVRAAA